MEDDSTALAEALQAAGRAHHEAFAHVDGHDPEWPDWYAAYLLSRLSLPEGPKRTLDF